MNAKRTILAASFLLFSLTPSFGGSRARFNGVDAKGVEVECGCFKIIFGDFDFQATMANFRTLEFLELRFDNPGKIPCEVYPYQFRLERPSGDILGVAMALSESQLMQFVTKRSFNIEPEEKKHALVLMPGDSKLYKLNFGVDNSLDKKKPSAFYYKDIMLGNFQYK